MIENIKETILKRIQIALAKETPLPLKDIIAIGEMMASFEQTELAKETLEVSKLALNNVETKDNVNIPIIEETTI